jgi:hypothetical protein
MGLASTHHTGLLDVLALPCGIMDLPTWPPTAHTETGQITKSVNPDLETMCKSGRKDT